MSIEASVTETVTPDLSALPATAFPEGADPSTYAASLKTGAEAVPETKTSTGERPAHIPEKFWDAATGTARVEDMAKSYAELEKRLSAGPKAEETAPSLKIEKSEVATEGANPLTSAFENFAKVYEDSKGAVGEETIAEIVKLGVPESVIANYMAGLEALGRENLGKAYTAAGGEEKFTAASEWAAKGGLTDAEIASYNTLVENPQTATQGIEWLIGKFSTARPTEGAFVRSEAGASTGSIFRNKAEMIAAMNDPQYRANPAFRTDVAEKVARSKAANTL
jgi:hypothetical protein